MTKPKSAKSAPKTKKRVKAGQNGAAAAQRRSLFIEAYLSNGENASQAAIAAGFSPKTAGQQGSRLLKNVKVQQELNSRRTKVLEKFQLTTENVLQSVAQALFFDPRKLFDDKGLLKPITELDDDTAQALAGIDITEEYGNAPVDEELEPQPHGGGLRRAHGKRVQTGYTAKLKWLDKNAARDQAAKMLGMYGADNRQKTDPLTALLLSLNGSSLPVVAQDPDHA